MKKIFYLLLFFISCKHDYAQITINKGFLGAIDISSTNAIAVDGGSHTFTAGKLYIMFSAATGATNAASSTSTTLTWSTLISTGNSTRRINMFYCMPASTATSETAGVSWGLAGTTGYAFDIWEISGVPTTSSGADAIVQSVSGGATGADPLITLSSLLNNNSAVISFFFNDANPFGGTAESGWTEDTDGGYASPTAGAYVMSRTNTTDNTPTVTASSSTWIGIALELKAGGRRIIITN